MTLLPFAEVGTTRRHELITEWFVFDLQMHYSSLFAVAEQALLKQSWMTRAFCSLEIAGATAPGRALFADPPGSSKLHLDTQCVARRDLDQGFS
jgi:hypothetical protein